MSHFADSINKRIKESSPLIVGIDPHLDLMPDFVLPSNASLLQKSLVDFAELVIDAVAELVPAVKFQSAFYEQYGSEGVIALGKSIKYAKGKNLLVILDAKRGDINSTSLAYATGYLSGSTQLRNGVIIKSDLEVDCITVNPFLGLDSLAPWIQKVSENKKGIFVLVKTSNPSSSDFQDIKVGEKTVSENLAELVNQWGEDTIGVSGYSCVGAVVGATFPEHALSLRKMMPHAIFLVPGSGAQGGSMESARAALNPDGLGAVISVSRAVTYPSGVTKLSDYQWAVKNKVLELRRQLEI